MSRWDQSERLKLVRLLADPAIVAFMADSPGGLSLTPVSFREARYSVYKRRLVEGRTCHSSMVTSELLWQLSGLQNGGKTPPDVRWNPSFPGDLADPGL